MKKDSSTAKTCIDIDDMPSINDPHIQLVEVPLIKADSNTFAKYGELVTDFEQTDVFIETWPAQGWRPVETGTGNEGGITQGLFEFERVGGVMVSRNYAVDGNYITGWFSDPAIACMDEENVNSDRVLVREANYHPDGGQVFFPVNGDAFIALLALPGDDVRPQDFVAFYCDGIFGIQIYANVWHQPIFPLSPIATFMGKQGRVHACVACDLVKEFNCYLSVPLNKL